MAVVRRLKAPHGAKIKVKRGPKVKAPKRSLITISTQGGKKMPPRRKKAAPKKRITPAFTVPGQSGTGVVKGSMWRITREADSFTIKKPPKKPKVKYV